MKIGLNEIVDQLETMQKEGRQNTQHYHDLKGALKSIGRDIDVEVTDSYVYLWIKGQGVFGFIKY